MAGRDTKAKVEAPEEFPDEAWEEPGPDGLTPAQFAARLSAKREQAAQDAGWVQPPQPDAPVDEVEAPEEPEEVRDSPEQPEEEPEQVEEEAPGEEEEPEEEPEQEEPEEEPEAEADEFYVARYRDRDSAEQGFREKDATINRLYRELHEQRQAIERAAEGEPEQLDVNAWQEWAEETVANGAGSQGAMAALQEGGEDGYDIYVAAWLRSEDEDERAAAFAFNNKVQRVFAERRVAMAQESFREQRSPTEEAQLARQRAAALHDDFDDFSEAMDRVATEPGLLPEETRTWLTEMAQTGLEGKVRAWDYLYMAAAAMGQPNRRKAKEVERRQRKASSDRAKVAAMVSSAEATPTRTPLTEAELTAIRYKNRLRERWDLPLVPEE